MSQHALEIPEALVQAAQEMAQAQQASLNQSTRATVVFVK
jgi:predicted HicB family RNase H-like nuclease